MAIPLFYTTMDKGLQDLFPPMTQESWTVLMEEESKAQRAWLVQGLFLICSLPPFFLLGGAASGSLFPLHLPLLLG